MRGSGNRAEKGGFYKRNRICWVDKIGKVFLVGGMILGVLRLGEVLEIEEKIWLNKYKSFGKVV